MTFGSLGDMRLHVTEHMQKGDIPSEEKNQWSLQIISKKI